MCGFPDRIDLFYSCLCLEFLCRCRYRGVSIDCFAGCVQSAGLVIVDLFYCIHLCAFIFVFVIMLLPETVGRYSRKSDSVGECEGEYGNEYGGVYAEAGEGDRAGEGKGEMMARQLGQSLCVLYHVSPQPSWNSCLQGSNITFWSFSISSKQIVQATCSSFPLAFVTYFVTSAPFFSSSSSSTRPL